MATDGTSLFVASVTSSTGDLCVSHTRWMIQQYSSVSNAVLRSWTFSESHGCVVSFDATRSSFILRVARPSTLTMIESLRRADVRASTIATVRPNLGTTPVVAVSSGTDRVFALNYHGTLVEVAATSPRVLHRVHLLVNANVYHSAWHLAVWNNVGFLDDSYGSNHVDEINLRSGVLIRTIS